MQTREYSVLTKQGFSFIQVTRNPGVHRPRLVELPKYTMQDSAASTFSLHHINEPLCTSFWFVYFFAAGWDLLAQKTANTKLKFKDSPKKYIVSHLLGFHPWVCKSQPFYLGSSSLFLICWAFLLIKSIKFYHMLFLYLLK